LTNTGSHVIGWGSPLAGSSDDLRLDTAFVSITGPRPDNQDAAFAGPALLVVADGVGGNVGGAVASALAVDVVRGALAHTADASPEESLRQAVEAANVRLGRAVAVNPGLAGMATTLTAVALAGGRLAVAHVGDTRAYLLRDGRLRRLTKDQTVVQSLVDAGVVTLEQARTHPLRSVLLGVLHGADGDTGPLETATVDVRPGDRLLVCSDGLSGVVEHDLLQRILVEEVRSDAAAQRLVRAALAAGTHDNVTAAVGDVVPRRGHAGSPAR
jgi:PPM family protein phosphatase